MPASSGSSVSVNMSVAQLVSPAFVELVTGMLEAAQLPPSRLVLELTETAMMLDLADAAARLAEALHLAEQENMP